MQERDVRMQRDQYEHLVTLDRGELPCMLDAPAGLIDLVLRGWVELVGDSVRITPAGRLAMATYATLPDSADPTPQYAPASQP